MEKENRLELTTLGNLGARLPIGVLAGDRYEQGLEVRPFTHRHQKQLCDLQENQKRGGSGQLWLDLVQLLCPVVGPYRLDAMAERERTVALSRMHAADILYAVMWARACAIGAEFPIQITCPNPRCGTSQEIEADLNDLDVVALHDDRAVDIEFDYELRDGLPVSGQERGRIVRLGPVPWQVYDSPRLNGPNGRNPAYVEAVYLSGAIRAVDGREIAVVPEDLDDVSVHDMAGMVAEWTARHPGPRFTIDDRCPECGTAVRGEFSWRQSGFFRRPSRFRLEKR